VAEALGVRVVRGHVVDSRSLSVGTGLVTAAVARAATGGADFAPVKRLARRLVDEVHIHAAIDDVDYLLRGGRAGLVDAHAGPGSLIVGFLASTE
jgi:fatty acid-binding protein DegV